MGININDAFPSNYLKASDLGGRNVTVTMANAQFEKMGDDDKLVLYFDGKDKGLVLNKTNANNIAILYGQDTDGWYGKQVTLVEALVDFQGRSVPAIRVRAPTGNQRSAPASNPQHDDRSPPPRETEELMDDEIPF